MFYILIIIHATLNKIKKYMLMIVLVFFLYLQFFAQGEIEEQHKFNRSEHSGALYLNSNGFGLSFRFGKRLDGYRQRLIDIDASWIKHPKENRVSNPAFEEQGRFVFGKLNTFYTIKSYYGRQKEIFSKFDKGGIAIKYSYLIGINIGLAKPVYYEVLEEIPNDPYHQIVVIQKFNENIHTVYDIYGKASFFEGIDETKIKPGISLKFGLSFEYGEENRIINCIEVGSIIDLFFIDTQIMAYNDSQFLFTGLYIAFRYGKTKESILD